MRMLAVAVVVLGLATPARADGEPFAGDGLFRPPIEWSTWLRGSIGGQRAADDVAARRIGPPPMTTQTRWELGLGVEASLALSRHGDTRLGAWAELRGLSAGDAFAGGELVLTRVPKRVDMFLYEGHGILALRAGRSTTHATAAIAYGYVAPYWLEGPCKERFYGIETGVCAPRPERTTRYMAGVRVVASVTRALDDPHAWSATIGVEFEPVATLRMLLVARSWY
jgi:hypothetical protein